MSKSASLLCLAALLFAIGKVEAQANFSKTYLPSGYDWSFGTNLQRFNDNYLFTLSEYPTSNQEYSKVRYLTVDEYGNVLNDRLLIDFESHIYPVNGTGTQVAPGKIHSLLFNRVSGLPQSFGLVTLNLTTDIVEYKDYGHVSTLAGYSLVKGRGDSLIIYADEVGGDDTSRWVNSLTFIDTETGADTTISYKGSYHRPQPGEIKTLPNGDILMAFGATDYSLPTPQGRGFLQKLSADGRVLWKKDVYPGDKTLFAPTLLPLPNGDIAYGWTKDSFSTSHPPAYYSPRPAAVFFLDSLGEFKSRTMLGPIFSQLYNLELLANGDILGMGQQGMYLNGSAGDVGWVFRLSPTGEKLWERLIAYPNTGRAPSLEFQDAVETPSGDILLAGMRNLEDDKFGSWLLKLSADGCYDPDDCEGIKDTIFIYEEVVATESPEEVTIGLEIFPNPTSGSFMVRLPAGYALMENATWSLNDVNGRTAHRQRYVPGAQVAPPAGLAAGMYVVRIETPRGVAQGKVMIRR